MTTRFSTAADGTQGNSDSSTAASLSQISADGRYVAFQSNASNLVSGDTNGSFDVFVADVACYAGGTAIRVVRSGAAQDVAVEDLRVGDPAVTADGRHRPIRWIGHRLLDCTRHPEPHRAWPVRIACHAFGENRPARDLLVSPGHAICLDLVGEVLIPAGCLVNATTVTQVPVDRVTYWHVELESHDILLAEGLPAESDLDCANRGFFANADLTDLAMGPDAGPDAASAFCRPLVETGPMVEFVRARLEARAGMLGWRRVDDPLAGLHLVADGRVVRPDVVGLDARFVLPAGARDVRLVSNAGVPAQVVAGATDGRRLGVPLAALVVDDGLTGARPIALDDPRLTDGFHDPEGTRPDGLWRWTDGSAVLPAALWEGCRGTVFLRVTLASPALPCWVGPRDSPGLEARGVC